MLVFKKNIYPSTPAPYDDANNEPCLDPYNFLLLALTSDRDLLNSLKQMDPEEGTERCKIFFPHASGFGPGHILNSISKRLLEGLVNPQTWYRMNSYHLCYLYDSLSGTVEEYSYEKPDQRRQLFPELQGEPIDFNRFLEEYFFNTAFLIDPGRYNNMDSEEKKKLGFQESCLFGVINRLIPANEEISLKKISNNPYTANEMER